MFTGSKKEIIDLIKQKGILSVDEAVEEIGLAKTTLRQHFLELERDNYVEREYLRSGPGRPSLQYQLTPKGNSLFPSSESAMLREMIKFLKSKDENETIEEFFEVFWTERLDEARRRMENAPADDIHSRVQVLMEMLEEEGFMPTFDFDEENKKLEIKECNCPFSEVVKETRLPCKLEQVFYRKLFNEKAERITYIPDEDYACTYDIPAESFT